jgi:hypothetical protein
LTTYIFPHVPKTGGSTIRKALTSSKLVTFFDYEFPPGFEPQKSKGCLRRNAESSLLDFSPFDIVYGHFPIERYQKDGYSYITLLRHPVDRAVSHFFYWKNYVPERRRLLGRKTHSSTNPVINAIRNGKCSFSEFLRRSRIETFYQRYFDYCSTAEFALVGFQHNYDNFYREFISILGLPTETPQKEKVNLLKEELSKKRYRLCN